MSLAHRMLSYARHYPISFESSRTALSCPIKKTEKKNAIAMAVRRGGL